MWWHGTTALPLRTRIALQDIQRRVTSIFALPSGKLLYGSVFRHLVLKDALAVERMHVHQYARDRIEVTLEKGPEFDETLIPRMRERYLKVLEGEPVELTIHVVDEIPTTASGKHLAATSDVPVRLT
jgi:hypothetical protein